MAEQFLVFNFFQAFTNSNCRGGEDVRIHCAKQHRLSITAFQALTGMRMAAVKAEIAPFELDRDNNVFVWFQKPR